jgi:release factor glutamine methyltransferase
VREAASIVESLPVHQALRQARSTLAAAGCDTAELDADVLLAHVLQCSRAWLYAHPQDRLTAEQTAAYRSLVERRASRQPVAYLLGHKEFFGLDFLVTPDVLIPRPETEQLVELALQLAPAPTARLLAADIGTGSGAIAVSLARHLPRARILASDISAAALAVARQNAVRHSVGERVLCVQADLLPACAGAFQLIVANLPYLSPADLRRAAPEVTDWEPRLALDGGADGLAVVRRLLARAVISLRTDGALLMEIGADQGTAVLELARRHFPHAAVEIARDLAHLERILVVRSGTLRRQHLQG